MQTTLYRLHKFPSFFSLHLVLIYSHSVKPFTRSTCFTISQVIFILYEPIGPKAALDGDMHRGPLHICSIWMKSEQHWFSLHKGADTNYTFLNKTLQAPCFLSAIVTACTGDSQSQDSANILVFHGSSGKRQKNLLFFVRPRLEITTCSPTSYVPERAK